MKLMLIGVKNCGKSTIGRELSCRWRYSFIDGDTLFLDHIRRDRPEVTSLSRYFPTVGAAAFYQQQAELFDRLWPGLPECYVLAAGGGIAEHPLDIPADVLTLLLEEDPQVIWKRVMRDGPPPFLNHNVDPECAFYQMMERRLPPLRQLAQLSYCCQNKPVELICDEIEELLHARK